MSIWSKLFPPENRQAAAVAWIRTFWQAIRGASYLGGAGSIVITAADLQRLNLVALMWIALAILSVAVLTACLSAGDILVHGLPSAYTDAPAPAPQKADGSFDVTSLPAYAPLAPEPVVTQTSAVPSPAPAAAPADVPAPAVASTAQTATQPPAAS